MSEYISKEELIKFVDNLPSELTEDGRRMIRAIKVKEYIADCPSADVRPNIHGHWELKYPTREEMIYCQERYFCSNCKGYVVDRIERLEFNFCPNCGADMREPKGEKGTE